MSFPEVSRGYLQGGKGFGRKDFPGTFFVGKPVGFYSKRKSRKDHRKNKVYSKE
jgi:hypothetical protein